MAAREGRREELDAWAAELAERRGVPAWRRMLDELAAPSVPEPPPCAPEPDLQVRCFGALAVRVAGQELPEKAWQSARARRRRRRRPHRGARPRRRQRRPPRRRGP